MVRRSVVMRVLFVAGALGAASAACTSASDDPPAAIACTQASDCPSNVCNQAKGVCEPFTCTDGARNGDESDLDCGGLCGACEDTKACKVAADCRSAVCTGMKCQAPTTTDGVKNGTETDADCGGGNGAPLCPDGKTCAARSDCTSDVCAGGVCTAPTPADGAQNGTETDVDCGGPTAARCSDTLKCLIDGDCKSDVCKDIGGTGLRCQVPTPTDGKKNGAETDIDCGGTAAPRCAVGKGCAVGSDCTSLGCNYLSKCAEGRSCTLHAGGDTCGLGGAGGVGAAQWEDCCKTEVVTPTAGPTSGTPIKLGKYQVTAGRMRAFLTDVSYDVRAFVKQARTDGKIPKIPGEAQRTLLEQDWDLFLPTSFAGNTNAGEIADCSQGNTTTATGTTCNPGTNQAGVYTAVKRHLGGFIFKGNAQTSTGCFVGAPGTHSFRFPDGDQDGSAPQVDQAEYDTRSMQCIDYLVAQAFCIWDGGRLELLEEWQAALGPGAYPWSGETLRAQVTPTTNSYWGCRFPWATDANQDNCGTSWNITTSTIEYAAYNYSYEYPKQASQDYIVFISAPGRMRGRGPQGHADLLGNNFELTSTVGHDPSPHVATHRWSGNGSWEGHGYAKGGGGTTNLLNKYGKLGLRCAYP
jgi:hypothetical protein